MLREAGSGLTELNMKILELLGINQSTLLCIPTLLLRLSWNSHKFMVMLARVTRKRSTAGAAIYAFMMYDVLLLPSGERATRKIEVMLTVVSL